jgi:signal transduction histidine kinase
MPPVSPTSSTAGEGSSPTIVAIAVSSVPRATTATSATTATAPTTPPAARPRADLLASFGPLVIAIRWATVAVGLALAALDANEPGRLLAYGAPLVVYAAARTIRPLRYLTDRTGSLVQVFFEVGLSLAVVVGTGFWASPYVFCLATAILAAGFARGFGFAFRTAIAAVLAVALPYHLEEPGARLLVTVQWGGELLLVGIIAGYARRLFGEAEEQDVLARQANDLLAQLHEVAQTLPTSLDLDDTVGQAIAELRERFPIDVAVVLLRDTAATTTTWMVATAEGVRLAPSLEDGELPPAARAAARDGRTVHDHDGPFLADGARVAVYAPLIARSRPVGLLAVEAFDPVRLTATQASEIEAASHRAALAIDNARWFTLLRRVGADEERTRIARDLHDRVGQSLAFVGFELDRLARAAATGSSVEDDLTHLREDVRRVVTEVRDTLYDLRTDVTERQGIVDTLATFLERVNDRTGVAVDLDHEQAARLPLRQERELWRIAQEAVTNATRHADASSIAVRWYCDGHRALLEVRDDGRGLPADVGSVARTDSYGLRGMRERAAAIGARLTIGAADGGGTLVRCEVGGT